jgi:hypothetical protein
MRIGTEKWDEQVLRIGETVTHEKPAHHLIAEVPGRRSRVEMTIGIDLREAATSYKVDTDAIALKVKREFAAKEKLKKAPKTVSKAKKAARVRSHEEGQLTGSPFCCVFRTSALRTAGDVPPPVPSPLLPAALK